MKSQKSVALVTGASSGIGLEMARILAAQGHPLVLVARSEAKLNELGAALRKEHGMPVWTFALDLGTSTAASSLYEFTKRQGIEVELLINNAGVGLYGEHVELDATRLGQMLQLNVATLAELSVLYGAEMKRRKSGKILNIASTAAYQPTPFFAAYGASKAFVLNFSEALAEELRDYNVTVSCLSPGPTDTGFFGEMDKRGLEIAHFSKSGREGARAVAEVGLETMRKGKLSRIVGFFNWVQAAGARFAPRWVVAKFAKALLRPSAGFV